MGIKVCLLCSILHVAGERYSHFRQIHSRHNLTHCMQNARKEISTICRRAMSMDFLDMVLP